MSAPAALEQGTIPPFGKPHALSTRLRLWGVSVGYVLLGIPALLLLCGLLFGLSLAFVGVGLALLLVLVPLTQRLADVHRRRAARELGRDVESPYQPDAPGGAWPKLLGWSRDPARWRDVAWTWAAITAGWILSLLAVGLGLGVLWYLAYPLVFALAPEGSVEIGNGLTSLDSQGESFLAWPIAAITAVLWWHGAAPLVRWRALLDESLLAPSRATLEARVARVKESRADTIDHSAAELRRIERDLHDGAQARLTSLGMSLGLAEQLLRDDPEQAAALLAEARATASGALGDIRGLVRGIHPPVLADRGLGGAVEALALDLSVPVTVDVDLPERPPAPVESAAYFAVAECLTNVVKHSGATRADVRLSLADGVLRVTVTDDGRGGADPAAGSGLAGLPRRLGTFDGRMSVDSPVGGPTTVSMEVPCASSSPRTTSSSVRD